MKTICTVSFLLLVSSLTSVSQGGTCVENEEQIAPLILDSALMIMEELSPDKPPSEFRPVLIVWKNVEQTGKVGDNDFYTEAKSFPSNHNALSNLTKFWAGVSREDVHGYAFIWMSARSKNWTEGGKGNEVVVRLNVGLAGKDEAMDVSFLESELLQKSYGSPLILGCSFNLLNF